MDAVEPVVTDDDAYFIVRVIVGTFLAIAAFAAFGIWRGTR